MSLPAPHALRRRLATLDPARRRRLLRMAILATGVLAGAGALALVGIRPSPGALQAWFGGLGAYGPVVFLAAAIGLSCLLVSGAVLAAAAGLLFGTAVGAPVALGAAVLAACVQLLVCRHVAGERGAGPLPARARRLDRFLEARGTVAVVCMRLAPGVPATLVNYASGLTRLRLRNMALGTAIGAAPRSVAYVALGGSLASLGSATAIATMAALAAVGLLGALLARRELARASLAP